MQHGLKCNIDQDATWIKIQRGSRCNKDQDAKRIKMQHGLKCNMDQDSTRIKMQRRRKGRGWGTTKSRPSMIPLSYVLDRVLRWFFFTFLCRASFSTFLCRASLPPRPSYCALRQPAPTLVGETGRWINIKMIHHHHHNHHYPHHNHHHHHDNTGRSTNMRMNGEFQNNNLVTYSRLVQ